MPTDAWCRFQGNRQDILRLWEIHEEVAGEGVGRKHDVEVLNRAAIVFVTASWESFIEDLAKEAFAYLIDKAPNALAVPSKVRDFATRPIFEQKDSRKVWELADLGWRDILIAHREETVKRWLGDFNTPKSKQVNDLYEELLGMRKLSDAWHWKNMSTEQAAKKLDDFVTIRGNIAHRVQHDEDVYKSASADYFSHVESLVERSEDEVCGHLTTITGALPWTPQPKMIPLFEDDETTS